MLLTIASLSVLAPNKCSDSAITLVLVGNYAFSFIVRIVCEIKTIALHPATHLLALLVTLPTANLCITSIEVEILLNGKLHVVAGCQQKA